MSTIDTRQFLPLLLALEITHLPRRLPLHTRCGRRRRRAGGLTCLGGFGRGGLIIGRWLVVEIWRGVDVGVGVGVGGDEGAGCLSAGARGGVGV